LQLKLYEREKKRVKVDLGARKFRFVSEQKANCCPKVSARQYKGSSIIPKTVSNSSEVREREKKVIYLIELLQ